MAKLADVLKAVKQGGEKTAAVAAPVAAPASTPSGDALKTALHDVLNGAEKTASVGTPIQALEKVASDVASAEHAALIKEAQLYGAATADGFMLRLAQYNETAARLDPAAATKTAAVAPGLDTFEKFASENGDLVKQAAEVGYQAASNQIDGLKQAAFEKGREAGVLAVYKSASECFVQGFEDFGKVLQAARA